MRLKDNNNPFIHVNPPYQLMVIHSSQLVYPRELYQRGVERKRVELIAAHFNEYVANEPKVSFRNGQFIVTDGQHTIEGRILRNGGKDLPILCKVYTGMTVEQEALLFAQQTGESARLTPGDKMRAMIYGGDPECMAFLKATESVGLKLDYAQRRGKYRLGCIGTAFEEFKRVGADLYKEALSMIVAGAALRFLQAGAIPRRKNRLSARGMAILSPSALRRFRVWSILWSYITTSTTPAVLSLACTRPTR